MSEAGTKPRWGGAPSTKCTGCGKTVYPAEKRTMSGQIWHVKCLRCKECNKILDGSNWGGFVNTEEQENTPLCSIHLERLRATSGTSAGHTGSTSSAKWTPKASSGSSSSSSGGSSSRWGGAPSDKCTGCGKTVYPAEKRTMQGQIWHVKCLRCKECNKILDGANWGGFAGEENTPLCKIHLERLRATMGTSAKYTGSTTSSSWTPKKSSESSSSSSSSGTKPRWGGAPKDKCEICGKTVYPAEKLSLDKKIFHGKCLKCVECGKYVTGANYGGLVPPNNTAYCKIHFDRMIAESGTATHISGSTTGSKWEISK